MEENEGTKHIAKHHNIVGWLPGVCFGRISPQLKSLNHGFVDQGFPWFTRGSSMYK